MIINKNIILVQYRPTHDFPKNIFDMFGNISMKRQKISRMF